jgi:Transposase DDE domain
MIIGPLAPPVQRFCRHCLAGAPGFGVWAGLILPILLHGLLLAGRRRTLRALGQATLAHWVCAGTVCRWLAALRFPVDRWHEYAFAQMLRAAARCGGSGDWVVIFDGTDTKRGGLAKIQNTRRYGKKPRAKKGGRPASQSHTLLFGLLLLPNGVRLPLPRRSWYTKAYAKQQGLPYRSQVQLAEEALLWLRPLLPAGRRLVVLADSLFDGQRLADCCRQHGWTFITKLKSSRTFADAPGTKVVAHGQALAASHFRRCRLVRGREATAGYRRQEPRRPRDHERRVYDYCSERRLVSRFGEAQVVYSWKSPAYTPKPDRDRRQFAALVTTDLRMPARRVIEYYELRWQIEVFFRELKGQLGLQDYRGTQFASYERFVTVALLGYLVLERQRLRGLQGRAPRQEEPREGWAAARTAALLRQVHREAQRADVRWIAERLRTPGGRKKLRAALRRAA